MWTSHSTAELYVLDSGTMEYWCTEDDCPAAICGGPHVMYVNSRGDERLCPPAVPAPPGYAEPPAGYVRLKDRARPEGLEPPFS
jgi:hypothetical protein